jgi:hypothetical protein
MTTDAWGWMEPPGDPDAAGQPAEFVDLEPNLPGAGVVPASRRVLLIMPAAARDLAAAIKGRSRAS